MGQHIVLFHSALGLRPAVTSWADRLRSLGHVVETPDLYDGAVFEDLTEGVRQRDAIGIPALIERAQRAVAPLSSPFVVAGFSLGVAAAEVVATSRPDVKAAILMHGAIPPSMIGVEAWPGTVAVQLHHAPLDPWNDADEVRGLRDAVEASTARLEVHAYDGSAHLFADHGLAEYDETKAELMFARTRAFLASLPG
jgi:dienelactone hydrolase